VSIILCGLPGCGKTTIGKLLAEKMPLEFVDIDRLLEQLYNKGVSRHTCREIYQLTGEATFRLLEKKVVLQIDGKTPKIIATGGGTLLDSDNVYHLKSIGKLAYLKGNSAYLFERAIKNGIPAFLDIHNPWTSYQNLEQYRSPIYEKAADYTIDIQMPIEHVIQTLYKLAEDYGK
jgi:shikimate kinase